MKHEKKHSSPYLQCGLIKLKKEGDLRVVQRRVTSCSSHNVIEVALSCKWDLQIVGRRKRRKRRLEMSCLTPKRKKKSMKEEKDLPSIQWRKDMVVYCGSLSNLFSVSLSLLREKDEERRRKWREARSFSLFKAMGDVCYLVDHT